MNCKFCIMYNIFFCYNKTLIEKNNNMQSISREYLSIFIDFPNTTTYKRSQAPRV